jgi:hypothetical protein
MADRKNGALIWGVLLILFGIGFLMQSLGLFVGMGALVWAGFMAFGGLVFLYLKAQSAENWWGLIPGLALLA